MIPHSKSSGYYVVDGISLLPILEKEIRVNEEVELRRIEPKSPLVNSVSSIVNDICGISTPPMVTYTIEDAMKKKLKVPNFSRKLEYDGIYGKPDIITVEGDIIELKSTTRKSPSDLTMCKGSIQSMIYGALKVMSDKEKVHYPRLYVAVGYYKGSNDLTAILDRIEIYTVNIKIEGLSLLNNVMTQYKAEYILNKLKSKVIKKHKVSIPAIPVRP